MKKTELFSLLRSTQSFAGFFMTGLLALGIGILLEIISFNHNLFVDLTPGKIHTFSDQTRQIIKSVDKDIQFTAFYRMGERTELDDFFQRLCNDSPRLTYRLIDLDRNPGKAKLYGITHVQTVIECEGNTRVINYPTEQRVVNAILKLLGGTVKTVYFSKGHHENEGYSDLETGLETENWKIGNIDLGELKHLSMNETVLVVAGPKKDFSEDEVSALERYIYSGGKVVLLLEPFTMIPNLEAMLKKFRIVLTEGIIVDTQNTLAGGDYLMPLITEKFQCPVTKGLSRSSNFLFPTARSVSIMEGEADGISILPLIRTSRNSWTKINKEAVKKGNIDFEEGVDFPGPLEVGVWVQLTGEDSEGKKNEGELIVFGDSDFILDAYYKTFANKDLFLNALEWLARDKDLISIRSKQVDYPFHFLSASQAHMLFWVSIVILPAIFLLISVTLFIYRRVHG